MLQRFSLVCSWNLKCYLILVIPPALRLSPRGCSWALSKRRRLPENCLFSLGGNDCKFHFQMKQFTHYHQCRGGSMPEPVSLADLTWGKYRWFLLLIKLFTFLSDLNQRVIRRVIATSALVYCAYVGCSDIWFFFFFNSAGCFFICSKERIFYFRRNLYIFFFLLELSTDYNLFMDKMTSFSTSAQCSTSDSACRISPEQTNQVNYF